MKLALACNNFPPEFNGGTERVVLALAQALIAQGQDVCVMSGSDVAHSGADVLEEETKGVQVLRLPRVPDEGYGLELGRPRLLALAMRLLAERQVDVLHLHHWATLSVRTLRAARGAGIGTVATLHDMWTTCPRFFRRPPLGITCPTGRDRASCGPCALPSLPTQPVWKLRLGVLDRDRQVRAELAAAGAITAPSEACAGSVRRNLPWPGEIEVVPHGLLEAPSRAVASPAAPSSPPRPMRIGTFGNLVVDKGVMVLVEAMAGVPDAELHLFGPFLRADFEREVRARAEALGVALTCHGEFDPRQRHPARALDLAVFPSLCEETYGLVVEEALARGVPVVVSDLGALAERIGGAGIVTPAGDVAGLRAALGEVAQDASRYAALRRAIPRTFRTITDAARRYVELYDAVRKVSP
ncbi:MAG: glycosyltransferase [Planctomycetota bacterium]